MKKPHLSLVPDLPPTAEPAPATKPEPKIDPRAVAFIEDTGSMECLRLLTALQGLAMTKGMRLTRHFTRTQCAEIVTDMTGIPVSGRSKARPPTGSLEVMLTWLIAHAESQGYEVGIIPTIVPHNQRGKA